MALLIFNLLYFNVDFIKEITYHNLGVFTKIRKFTNDYY